MALLGGSCQGGVHTQRHKCPGEDTPTQHISYFFLPCLTSACSTRMQRTATGLLHLPSASTEEQRSQQKETKCSTTAGINTEHCCCLTHFSEQQGPLSDFCRRSAKVKTEEGASFHFQSETLSLGMGAESVNFLLKSEKISSKIYQLFTKIVVFLQSMETATAPPPTEL